MYLLTRLVLECSANAFQLNYSNRPSETQIKRLALARFFLVLVQQAPLSTVTHSQRLTNFQPLFVMPLEKSALAANGHAIPMKWKIMIQSAFDIEYTFNIEHMADASDSPEAPMNIL